MNVSYDDRVDQGAEPVPDAAGRTLYRIVQEGLTNVVRHAGLVTTTVRVRQDHGQLVVDIESAAPTRHASTPGAGRGLAGMRVRAAAVGGTVEAGRCGDGGFAVHAELPLGARPTVGAT
jgi:signal transduction histidine kinase